MERSVDIGACKCSYILIDKKQLHKRKDEEPKERQTDRYNNPGVDSIQPLNEPYYTPCLTHILSTSGWL